MITLSEEEWISAYKPIPAPSDDNGFDFGNGCTLNCAHTPGEIAALEQADESRIWTVVDDGESTAITAGRHFVNRLGYIITENAWDSDLIEVVLED